MLGYETGYIPTFLLFYNVNYNFFDAFEGGVKLWFTNINSFRLSELSIFAKQQLFFLSPTTPFYGYLKFRSSAEGYVKKDYTGSKNKIIEVVSPYLDNGTDLAIGFLGRSSTELFNIKDLYLSYGTDLNLLTGRDYFDFEPSQKFGIGLNINLEKHYIDEQITLGLENRFFYWMNRGNYFESVPQLEWLISKYLSMTLGVSIPVFSGNNYQFLASLNYMFDINKAGIEQGDFDLMVDGATNIKIEDVKYREHFPMLNYIFFDKNSSELNKRYIQLNEDQVYEFDEANLPSNQIEIYHNILNIIGKRLLDKPNATIELIGCNDNEGSEKNNTQLSKSRAEIVKDYLVSIWKITNSRIKIKYQKLPSIPSNIAEEKGREENRRVEISSKDEEILSLVQKVTTYKGYSPDVMDFNIRTTAQNKISNWDFRIIQNKSIVHEESFQGEFPTEFKWDLMKTLSGKNIDTASIFISMRAEDINGKISTPFLTKVDVTYSSLAKNIEKVSLVLFDFNSSEVDTRNKNALLKLSDAIRPTSKITVNGYTDIIGTSDYNQRLSEERAKSVAAVMQRLFVISVKNVKTNGLGETSPIFDNSLPEGRFYNRTCQVINETLVTK